VAVTSFVNACVFTPVSSGTVDFVVSAAVTGWQTPVSAGAVDGATYRYRAASTDGTQWEIGTGIYTVSTTTLTRATVTASSTGSKVSFTSSPQVTLTIFSIDISTILVANSGLVANTSGIFVNANTGITANSTGTFADLTVVSPLASPVFTGTPSAPNPASGASNTQIATTLFVAGGTTINEPNIGYNVGLKFSVAANALTANVVQFDGATNANTSNPIVIGMRSATLSSGGSNLRTLTGASSLVIPSGATIGHTSAVAGNLHWYLVDNAGTLELAVAGSDLGSSGIVTTVAITSGSTSATVMYSTTLRTSVPFRKISVSIDTQTTAGTWTSVPSSVTVNPGAMISDTSYLANSGLASNSSGIYVLANSGIAANSTGTYVNANNGLIANSSGLFVNANTGITANSSGLFAAGGGSATYTANVGDASTTTFALTHNLNKTNLLLAIRDVSSGYFVYPDVIYTNTNSCSIVFSTAPTANQYFATITGT
jgi:hypothetical protein